MLKMQILRPCPQTTESKTLGLWPGNLFFNKSFRGFWCTSFRAHLLGFRKERKGTLIFFMLNWKQCLWRQVTSRKCLHGCPSMDINPYSWPSTEQAVREDHSHLSVRYLIMARCSSATLCVLCPWPIVGVHWIVIELRNKGRYSICQQIWKTQQWPQDWKRSVFIPIPNKGNAKECSNYCTIALISHASKVMLKIL